MQLEEEQKTKQNKTNKKPGKNKAQQNKQTN